MTAVDTWMEAALDRQSTVLALIAELPPSSSQQQAIQLAATPELESRVYALRMVSQEHAIGGEPQAALVLALAGMQFCMRCYDRYGPGMAQQVVGLLIQIDALHAYLDSLHALGEEPFDTIAPGHGFLIGQAHAAWPGSTRCAAPWRATGRPAWKR